MKLIKSLIIVIIFISLNNFAQEKQSTDTDVIKKLEKQNEYLEHRLDVIQKNVDDVIWFQRVGDAAFIDKVYITGPPTMESKKSHCYGSQESA